MWPALCIHAVEAEMMLILEVISQKAKLRWSEFKARQVYCKTPPSVQRALKFINIQYKKKKKEEKKKLFGWFPLSTDMLLENEK